MGTNFFLTMADMLHRICYIYYAISVTVACVTVEIYDMRDVLVVQKEANGCLQGARSKHVSLFHDFFKISRLKKKKFPDFCSRKISQQN